VSAPAVTRISAGARELRPLNRDIRTAVAAGEAVVVDDTRSRHNLGVGLTGEGSVVFEGSVGYYCGGLLDGPSITVNGNAGWAVAESMAHGRVVVNGTTGMSAGANMRGGVLHISGRTGPRCGIAMKGGDIVVEGDVGYSSAFMAHLGRLVVLGNSSDGTGDSLWGGEVWVAGRIGGLGVDAVVTEPTAEQVAGIDELLASVGVDGAGVEWKRIVSGQKLWHFTSRDARAWLMI
jgi:methylamine---glutamate N-methyltransferase subunit B